jgi:hypothetical protein
MRTTSYPARIRGVATARIPRGAVASELAKEGKKNTTFFEEEGVLIESLATLSVFKGYELRWIDLLGLSHELVISLSRRMVIWEQGSVFSRR